MTPSAIILILVCILVQMGLLLQAVTRPRPWPAIQRVVLLALAAPILAIVTFAVALALGDSPIILLSLGWLGLAAWLTATGMLLYAEARPRPLQFTRYWLAANATWFIAALAFQILAGSLTLDALNGSLVVMAGSSLATAALILLALRWFYKAPLPELANRAAFWALLLSVIQISLILLSSASSLLVPAGALLATLGSAGLLYLRQQHRIADLRLSLATGLRLSFLFGCAVVLITINNLVVDQTQIQDDLLRTGMLLLFAVLTAALLIPSLEILLFLFRILTQRTRRNATIVAEFSLSLAQASTLAELIQATRHSLEGSLGIRGAALVLVNNSNRQPDSIEFLRIDHPSISPLHGSISKQSPIYLALAEAKVPIGQYDLLYGPAFQRIQPTERAFFETLNMRLYIPILAEGRLLGFLACGPRRNDGAYQRGDVELLMIIGQQLGNALRSARLIDDLQHLNENMRILNKRLEGAKEELLKLDSIKTDFVTIASHELRTPLAQIRGYTDIIDSLSQQESTPREQIQVMLGSLRKSSERMEELITAMLDVSQLDVNAMDLRFVRTKPETIIRLALEPMQEALKQRKIVVEQADLSGLPHIQADMQRMVQAFRNILQNAIKFTPDSGTIHIRGLLEDTLPGESEPTIRFEIEDTGIGIATRDLEYIFRKFYRGFDTQLHSTGVTKFLGAGPGLGLTIARGIIEGHGGSIWASSSGQDMTELPGSTFFVRLPLTPPKGPRRVLPFEEAIAEDSAEARTDPHFAVPSADTEQISTAEIDMSTQQIVLPPADSSEDAVGNSAESSPATDDPGTEKQKAPNNTNGA